METISASTLVLLSEIFTFSGYIAWMIYVRLQGAGFRHEGIRVLAALQFPNFGREADG